jgi:hypothetical protein
MIFRESPVAAFTSALVNSAKAERGTVKFVAVDVKVLPKMRVGTEENAIIA